MKFSPPRRSVAILVHVLLLLVAPNAALHAQQAPYDVFPPADPPYYRVRYEPSKKTGELIYGVNFTAWIPRRPENPARRDRAPTRLRRGVVQVGAHGGV